jgi:hypothetical protein
MKSDLRHSDAPANLNKYVKNQQASNLTRRQISRKSKKQNTPHTLSTDGQNQLPVVELRSSWSIGPNTAPAIWSAPPSRVGPKTAPATLSAPPSRVNMPLYLSDSMSIVAVLAVVRGRAHRRVRGPSRRGRMIRTALAVVAARAVDESEHGKARGMMWTSWGP